MKKYFLALSLLFFSIIGIFFWQVWQNNQTVESPSPTEIKQHFLKSVSWLEANYSNIENIQNPILWWMIKQAALNSGNESLNKLFNKYKKNHLDVNPPNLSTPMFDRLYHPRVPDISFLSNLRDYQTFFFYALSCDNELSTEPLIQK